MPFDEYLAYDAIDQTGLKNIAISPKYYKAWKGKAKDTKALKFGRAFHMAILEHERFMNTYIVAPEIDKRTKEGKIAYTEFEIRAHNREIISHEDMEMLKAMADSVHHHAPSMYLLEGSGINEVSLFWVDEETGLECKARIDRLRDDGFIIDLKTTEFAKPENIINESWKYMYRMQDAFYCDGYKAIKGEYPKGSGFIFVEKKLPYDACATLSHEELRRLGKESCRKHLETYARCKVTDTWPGYADDEVIVLTPPAWVKL